MIDDNLDVCREIKYSLQNETTDVYYVLSAHDAIEQLTKHQFCIVIMDILLSEADGMELLKVIRQIKPVDPALHQATLKGESLNLTRKEFDLLFCLAENAGQVLSREQLYNNVWNEDAHNVDDLIKTHIKAIRRKLSSTGKDYIKNVWGIGYRFAPDDEEQP